MHNNFKLLKFWLEFHNFRETNKIHQLETKIDGGFGKTSTILKTTTSEIRLLISCHLQPNYVASGCLSVRAELSYINQLPAELRPENRIRKFKLFETTLFETVELLVTDFCTKR